MPVSNVSSLALNLPINYARNIGTATLVLGAVTVNDSGISASSIILLTGQDGGLLSGIVRVSSRINGTSFTITSTILTDTATIGYVVF